MKRFLLSLVLIAGSLLVAPSHARGACGTNPGDPAAVADVRSLVEQQCDCATAVNRRVYLRCVAAVLDLAVTQNRLSTGCTAAVKKCATKSTCGRPGAVACCRTKANGQTKCSVKPR